MLKEGDKVRVGDKQFIFLGYAMYGAVALLRKADSNPKSFWIKQAMIEDVYPI